MRLEKSVFMLHGENTTVIIELKERAAIRLPVWRSPLVAARLELRPLIAFRDYHSLGTRNGSLNPRVETSTAQLRSRRTGFAVLHSLTMPTFCDTAGYWYRNFEYREERERGFDFTEDLFSPFVLKFD